MDAIARLNKSLAGRYTIEAEVGRGGMAAVYLAHDERHDRPVALKLFDAHFGAAVGSERFLAEIRITAKLQHPALVPLFDSGEAGGALFYVMPFVDGENLRAKLGREKQVMVDEALRITTSVADAMTYAHRHGVVHRDLKPENILLHEGRVLVADFGIALAMGNAGGPRLTQTGVSLGTPQYMSPEQASGDGPVDARSDIYSLGAVLYEMLTGDPPHNANTTQALVARILTQTPVSPRTLRPAVPAHVDMAIMRALQKLPADRWPNAEQFAEALTVQPGVALPPAAATPGTIQQRSSETTRTSARTRWIGAGAIAATAIVIAVAWPSWSAPNAASVSFVLEPPSSVAAGARVAIGDVAVSDDGQLLAYVLASDSASAVYVRKVDDVTSTRVRGTEGAFFVSFSPDARWLAVATTDRRLLKVAVDGSSSLTLLENRRLWGGVAWESNESLILPGDGLQRVSASGGMVRRVTTPRPQRRHYGALIADDGETVAFWDSGLGFTEDDFLAIGSLKTGQYHTTSLLLNRPIAFVDDHIVYVTATGAIMAVPFTRREQRVTGDPIRLMEGLVFDVSNAKMSPTGTLVYRAGRRTNRLVVERDGRTTEILPQLNGHMQWLSPPRYSPDGNRVAVNVQAPRGDTLTSDIWILDVASRSFTQLSSLGNVVAPEWTPDGRYLVFTTWFSRQPSLWIQATDGSRPAQRLFAAADGATFWEPKVTRDGAVTFCAGGLYGPGQALYSVPLSGATRANRIDVLDRVCGAEVSPDGRWLAYVVEDGQKRNVYVRAYRRPGSRLRVSRNGGTLPRWSRDGRRLYYAHETAADGSGALFAADLRFSASDVAIAGTDSVAPLMAGRSGPDVEAMPTLFDVARDGSVLRLEPLPWTDQVVVKTNWLAELRAKLK